ncbi:MAG: ERF family protein [Bacteroidales bacterium]|nr:ERF family protein [Bacteroidales bacterium]
MEKLAKIQKELKAPKDLRNNFGGYNYRSAESILEAVKPLLDGAILTLEDDIMLVGDRFYIKATATFQDGDYVKTTTAFAREPETKKGMDDSQITGTASSYARKYALNGLFCIDDNKDADTDEYQKQTKEPEHKTTVEDIIKSIEENMTLDNCKKFYARAIELYGKETPDYKIWVKVWADKKDILEKSATISELSDDAEYLAEM